MATEAKGGHRMLGTHSSAASATFDPDRLAYLETEGWRAYYDHRWVRAFRLLVQLSHEQFGLSWPRAVQAAYYITRASVAWAPKENDPRKTRLYIRKFYRVAARYGKSLHFDPVRVADLELRYWDVHRRLSGKPDNEKAPLVQSLVDLHGAIFGLPEDKAKASGVGRARAADTVDLITSLQSTDVQGDWRRIEIYLQEAYRSIKAEL